MWIVSFPPEHRGIFSARGSRAIRSLIAKQAVADTDERTVKVGRYPQQRTNRTPQANSFHDAADPVEGRFLKT